ncbi:hypothetical protein BASA81_000259 [Batrachochytrium salamandrivorans]|nr:hypothetical protein BASA81_000259 [Batrachochytrium salamandrivorans]
MDWEGIWKNGLEVGERWDVGQPEPEFVYELNNPQGVMLHRKRSRALVPGCGRGYAAKAAADAGYDQVLALDISPHAVAAAKETFKREKISFEVGDFFAPLPAAAANGGYDLVLDSTFCTALPPALRDGGAWAKQMQQVLAVGGVLMMHVFPIPLDGEELGIDLEGPPYLITCDRVRELFAGLPFKEVLCRDIPEERSTRRQRPIRGKAVRDALMVWERI